MDIYETIVRLRTQRQSAAMATIVQTVGSCPQKVGAKLLVCEDGTCIGTLGGGAMEAQLIAAAKQVIDTDMPRTVPIILNEQHGEHVCGGKLEVFIEPLLPPLHLVIVGAGHVGKALAQAAKLHGWRITVIDDRADFANPQHLPTADHWEVARSDNWLDGIAVDARTGILIATRTHARDFNVAMAALRTPAFYIGMIGSQRKRAVLHQKLLAAGFDQADSERIVSPAGLSIGAVTPAEIAVSIVAQLITLRSTRVPSRLSHHSCSGPFHPDGSPETTAAVSRSHPD